jgi:hypothetical protein
MSGKIKEIRKVISDQGSNINDMFQEMLGMKDADPYIIIPKFVKSRNIIRQIYKILKQLSTFQSIRDDYPETIKGLDEIDCYAEKMKDNIYFEETKEDNEETYNKMNKEDINNLYKKLKENNYVKQLIALCGKLKQYYKNFENIEELKDNFIGQEVGLSFYIFPFSSLDLKLLWANNNFKPIVKKYILTILHKLYKSLFELYKIITSADVDIEQFSSILMMALGELKKHPKLHRCRNAFKRIEQSVNLLKDNFDQYFRDSVSSSNVYIMLENFICDVSSTGSNNTSVLREFRLIIQYMREMGEKTGRNKDPNIQNLFTTLNSHYNIMEQKENIKFNIERKRSDKKANKNNEGDENENEDDENKDDENKDDNNKDDNNNNKDDGETNNNTTDNTNTYEDDDIPSLVDD